MISETYKALVSDVDGTLLLANHDLPSPKVTQSIQQAIETGCHVILATARQVQKTAPLIDYLHLTDPCILSNGAQIYDPRTKQMIEEHPIDLQVTLDLCERLAQYQKQTKVPFKWWVQDDGVDFYPPDYTPHKPFVVVVSQIPLDLSHHLINHLSDIKEVLTYRGPGYTDSQQNPLVDILITHPLATKQQAIFRIAELLKLKPEEVIGIGDGNNDIPLLEFCGLKVAMGNGVPALKAIAQVIAPPVEEDGLAKIIDQYILDKN